MSRKQRRVLTRIIISSVLTLLFFILEKVIETDTWVKIVAFSVPYLIIGYDVLWGAVRNIFRGQVFDEKFLMTIATLGAFAVGEFPEAAGVMLFYQVGELFQSIAVGKSRRSISSLMDIRPDTAVVIRDGEELTLSPDEVKKGEMIIIRPGDKIPLDGVIVEGRSTVNTSALTGESLPREVSTGERIISGSLNLSGVIKVCVESEFGDSTVSKILELVENASSKKAKAENFITKFARYYTPAVVISAFLLALVPSVLGIGSPYDWIKRALIFLMVSCPCALVISVPLSFFGAIGSASRSGILIKGSSYMEVLASVDTVVFDKTGTLTEGSFAVDAIHPSSVSPDLLLDIAALAESYSTHPVAESIISAHGGHLDVSRVGEVTELSGRGIKAYIDGKLCYVGNGKLMSDVGIEWHPCHLSGTTVHIATDTEYLGHIVINDKIKESSKDAISALKDVGVKKTVMLTGDSESIASKVANTLGLDEYHSELLPADKVEHLERLISNGNTVAFVGDGINDAPVLTRSDVGIAMGALGSDAAIESADIVLMDDDPKKISKAIRISRKALSIVKQNIIFALTVKIAILIVTAIGFTNTWVAVFGDVGVMVLAILNAMRNGKQTDN